MSEVIKAPSKAVMSAIERANKEHKAATDKAIQVRESVQASLTHAIKCGQALLKVKAKNPKGFKALFDPDKVQSGGGSNCTFSFNYQWAARYIKAAKFPAQARLTCDSEESFSLDRTYKALSGASEETEKEAKATTHVTNNTGLHEWYTPPAFLDSARQAMGGIDLDPSSNSIANENVGAAEYFTRDDDGLSKPWSGRVWMNPPYEKKVVDAFAAKLVEEFEAGRVSQAITLTNNSTDTLWFHHMLGSCAAVCLVRGRIRFLSPDGEKGAPLQGQTLMYFGDNAQMFSQSFAGLGVVLFK